MSPRYYPLYYRQTRRFVAQLPQTLVALRQQGRPVDALTSAVIEAVTKDVMHRPGVTLRTLMMNGLVTRESMAAQTHAQFEIHGSHIIDVQPLLTQALRHSNGGDLTIVDLVPPASSFYIHTGQQPDVCFNGDVAFEGAYVLADSESWRIVLCGRSGHHWWEAPYEVHTLRIPKETLMLPVDQAIEAALTVDRQDLEQSRRIIAAEGLAIGRDADAAVNDLLAAHQAAEPALKTAMRLCAQVIAYMTTYRDDVVTDWPEDTPERLREKTQPAHKPKERERALSKLKSLGFVQAAVLGRAFTQAVETAEQGRPVSPHWRSGHWRHQPYGPHHALRKLIWIQPTRVAVG